MTLAVFGANGRTGIKLVESAIARGHRVNAYCRRACSLALQHANLAVIEGTLVDSERVRCAIAGSDAVVMAFGPRPPYTEPFCAKATATIVDVMVTCGTRRVLCLTGAMVGDQPVNRTFLFNRLAGYFKKRLPAIAADRVEEERLIRNTGLDWTLVKPPRLTDAPATGRCKASPDLTVGLLSRISRVDLANFLLDQVGSAQFVRQAVVVRG